MRPSISVFVVLTLCSRLALAQAPEESISRKPVDLAICLDTSGSMNGLIDAARQKLWAIVNDLALARPAPRLRVALLTYGNDGHPAEDGWVCVQTPLTEDLDLVSQKLFALTTNGGTEYVGRVLNVALERLDWESRAEALKLAIVAGNESADQDQQVNFRVVCKRAIEHGIMVNAIYCGNAADQLAPVWREVAQCADGQFACIDQNQGTVAIATPFDQELTSLSTALNETYIPFGQAGKAGQLNQCEQDQNAAGANSAAAACRAATKASGLYQCSWDLVDAVRQSQVKLADVKTEDLPDGMRKMSPEERERHLAATAAKRADIQKNIQAIDKKRQEFVSAELVKQAKDESKGFDHAVRQAVRAQAATRGFSFASP